jgi:hypothetical protein
MTSSGTNWRNNFVPQEYCIIEAYYLNKMSLTVMKMKIGYRKSKLKT